MRLRAEGGWIAGAALLVALGGAAACDPLACDLCGPEDVNGTGGGDPKDTVSFGAMPAPESPPDGGNRSWLPACAQPGEQDTEVQLRALPSGSWASAQYAEALVQAGLPLPPGLVDRADLASRFAPEPGPMALAYGVLGPASFDDPSRVELDVSVLPSAAALVRTPIHLVLVADLGRSMRFKLLFQAETIRRLGAKLDVPGDTLTVFGWSAAPSKLIDASPEPPAAASDAAAQIEQLVDTGALAPNADLLVLVDELAAVAGGPSPTHVVLLTDGASPISLDGVARLRRGSSVISIAQLAPLEGAVPSFAGTLLREVSAAGAGAALWLGGVGSLPPLERDFDRVFRTVQPAALSLSTSYTLEPSGDAFLSLSPNFGAASGAWVGPVLGLGAPTRVVVSAEVCSPEYYEPGADPRWWGSFALLEGPSVHIDPESAAQQRWELVRAAYEMLSNGCARLPPLADLPGLIDPFAAHVEASTGDPRAKELHDLVRGFVEGCAPGALGDGSLGD